jgi:DNA helicase-2/ATP-dependent DNA helicase PcrA
MTQHADYETESVYLQSVLSFLREYHNSAAKQKSDIDKLVAYSLAHYNSDNPEQFIELVLNTHNQDTLTRKVSETRYALEKPYFARVDFNPDDQSGQRLYIGKMNLMRGLTFLITDWRAPVSSLYYEGRMGRASYACPDGLIEGEITLKRQFTIKNGQIESITDIDITTNDEFLQAALGASKDRRLKDIVTTIQAEQNKIIRAPMYTPLVVQGAAGSGKTTIALHRIAYLLYTFGEKLLSRQVMIMAPNRFFLSYISDVLPDLGVERVRQTTFEEFTADCIELPAKWKVIPSAQTLADAINQGEYNTEAMKDAGLKGNLRFMSLIERYCGRIENRFAPKDDFILEGYELFTHEALEDLFLREYAYLPVSKRAAEIEKHLRNTLRREKPLILGQIDADFDRRRLMIKRRMPDGLERRKLISGLLDERDEVLKRVKYKSSVIIRQYMKRFAMEPVIVYYRELFAPGGLFEELAYGLFTPAECQLMISRNSVYLADSRLKTEDMPPLLLMQMKLFGLEDHLDIKHVVIDEAQDFSLFQFAALKALTVNASFSILGDLHQGIYAYKSINSWESLRRQVFPNQSEYMTLEQSYRTTAEIMDAANQVIGKLQSADCQTIPPAKPVIRRGPEVTLKITNSLTECACEINKKIKAYHQGGYRSIAVIGKTMRECKTLKKLIDSPAQLITGQENTYEGGLLIIPAYLVKGLEFDAVIIANASAENYKEEDLDIRLLYVSMTRALHELALFTAGEPSKLAAFVPEC